MHQKKGRDLNGVNTIIVLAISKSVPENHHNVEAFFKAVRIWKLKFIMALDHKMKNLVCGIMSNSSSFPCINCKTHKSKLDCCGEERTVAS